MEGPWKFWGGGGGGGGGGNQKPKCLEESMELNWYFQRGGEGLKPEVPSVGDVWYFLQQHKDVLPSPVFF